MNITLSSSAQQAFMQMTEEQQKVYSAAMEEYWKSGRVEWHCAGRHGVIRGVLGDESKRTIMKVITYFMGEKSSWWVGDDVEFVYAGDFNPPKRPWDWCGTSVLFEDWHQQEVTNMQLLRTFSIGDTVTFDYKGETLTGVISGMRKRATVIVPGRGKYYMPASWLRR